MYKKQLIRFKNIVLCIPRKVWHYFKQSLISFLSTTQIHGYKYLVMPNRPLIEKIIWATFLFIVSGFTVWTVVYMYLPFLNTPTLTTELPEWLSVDQIPFPSVAFCPNNRISRKALLNYSEYM